MNMPYLTKPVAIAIVALGVTASNVAAQSSSLFGDPAARAPLTLEQNSWFYVPVEPPKEIDIHSIITVVVDDKSQVISEGDTEVRKQGLINATLEEFPVLKNGNLKPSPQSDGDPEVSGTFQKQYRAEADLETREGLKFRIACEVVDIRPNGNLVLEGHFRVKNNDEVWERSLSGIIRPEDVLPNNTVLSENVAELSVAKRERGYVRNGYRRGWFLTLWDRLYAF